MKGSNEPRAYRKASHMRSKRVMIAARVRSIVGRARPPGRSWARDKMGGSLRTFNPHPVYAHTLVPAGEWSNDKAHR